MAWLSTNRIYLGDTRQLIQSIEPDSVALSFWSPPYFLGKDYEKNATYESWQQLLKEVIQAHFRILRPGGFMVINIADILSFQDKSMPRFMGLNPSKRKIAITEEMIVAAQKDHPEFNRRQLASLLGCSEQTIDRRLHGNNIRGGRHAVGTHVKLVGGNLEEYAYSTGLYLYDKRIWKKDPAWANSRWTSNTLKAVSETEDLYVFWKPGEYVVNKNRLTEQEWKEWGFRQVWEIPSVRANDTHPAMFPEQLATRVIMLYTDPGDLVLDPFLGSGTTAVASFKAGRKYIGFEKMNKYFKLAQANINDAFNKKNTLFSD